MGWYMIARQKDDEISEMNYRNLHRDLGDRFRKLGLPSGFKVFCEKMSGTDIHYYFTPTTSELAKDILETYKAFSTDPPKSLKDMCTLKL